MNFLLDTDTCVFWLRGRGTVRDRLVDVGLDAVAISIITLAELRYGAACSTQPEANHQTIDGFVSGVAVVEVDATVVRAFGEIKAGLRQQGLLIEDFDLLIAATARIYNLILVTNNTKHHSRVPGLRMESWI